MSCAAALLLAPGAATAAGPSHPPGPVRSFFEAKLQSPNGYVVSIANPDRHHVQVLVSREYGSTYTVDSASYSVPGTIARDGLSANLGRFGRISLRFHGRPVRWVPDGERPGPCQRHETVHEVGTFTGTIRFAGEGGYASVSAKRASGYALRESSRACPAPARRAAGARAAVGTATDRLFLTTLFAASRTESRSVRVEAFAQRPLGAGGPAATSTLVADERERVGRVLIDRNAYLELDPASFPASPLGATPVTATLTAPSPFSGTAAYLEQAGSPASWSGDLSVDFPGATVALAGPEFTPVLCRGMDGERRLGLCQLDAERLLEPPPARGR